MIVVKHGRQGAPKSKNLVCTKVGATQERPPTHDHR
jgi:hypothetical protein